MLADLELAEASLEKKEFRKAIITGYINDSVKLLKQILTEDIDKIERIVDALLKAYHNDKQIFLIGNGGSYSIASHLAADFSKAWLGDRLMRLRSFCLSDNTSLLTSWMNDSGPDHIFAGPLQTLLNEGDIVIGISGSGNSKNILYAIEYANKKGALTIGFTGFDGGKLKDLAAISFVVKSDSFKRIEDTHMLLGHLLKSVLVNEVKRSSNKST